MGISLLCEADYSMGVPLNLLQELIQAKIKPNPYYKVCHWELEKINKMRAWAGGGGMG